jgi:formate hydrogenlyase subunit 3/multisubunit Na+/H+ antiporter MnhD subunit
MLFDLPGWAGMFQRMETHPSEAPANANVQLTDFAAVQSILARSSIEYLAAKSGWDTKTSLGSFLSQAPLKRHEGLMDEPWQNPSGVAFKDQNLKQRESLEAEYEYTTMRAIGGRTQVAPGTEFQTRPVLQVYTCIDERECSFRRHLEEATGNPDEIETFGVPGFFNFAIRYLGAEADSRHSDILAPEGNKPEPTMVEERDGDVVYNQRRQLFARLELAWERASFSPLGSLWLAALSPFTFVGLAFMSIFPTTKRRLMENFWASTVGEPKRDYKLPLTHKEAALRLAQTFQNIGVKDRFSPIVMLLGHGSRTVNNPFDAAHNCGACGGREGGPNARLMARCANDPEIRAILAKDYGIMIPDDTHFIGGYHDTTSELVELFDVGTVPPKGLQHFRKAMEILYKGRGNNALERCSKFMLASNCRTTKQALTHVHTRSTDLGEARPELGHATNASVIIGRRELTKGLFLARRAFLPSYDPFNDDDRGTNLERVITPALIVCSGISLEYLFSTTDGGAGTKVCMNVVGNHGVMQGVSGDLLVGLPTQMTEMHSPLRALYVVDAPVARVQAALSRNDTIRNIVVNDWVRLFVRDPNTNIIYRQEKGDYVPVDYDSTYGMGKNAKTFVPFTHQANYVTALTRYEAFVATLSAMVMLLSCVGSIYFFGAQAMHERGSVIAMAGTALALCALAFQRRYLHGEFMFDRFCILAALLLTGFNMVATAPTLANVSVGWNLIGFTSAFLIGSYNDRPTVKQHTTYVFFIYRISDVALLLAAAFNDTLLQSATTETDGIHASLVAGGLLVAALLKTSQFPVNNLFARSMEGTSPGSAIGDASLAAHIGIVMLSGTMPLWFGFNWARYVLSVIGLITVCTSGLVAKIRSDRKGSIGYATSASIGLLYIILAMGYADIALFLAFGHAALRMVQILRAVNHPLEYHHLTGALEHKTEPKVVPEGWFKLGWRLNRMSTDMSLPPLLHMFRSICKFKPLELGKYSQWLLTTVLIVLAGMPFTPLTQFNDQVLMNLLHTSAYKAVALMIFFIVSSTCLFSWVMTSVLTAGRFEHSAGSIEKYKGGNPNFGVSNNPEFVKSQDESLSSPSESASNSLTEPLLKTDSPLPHVHNPQMGA